MIIVNDIIKVTNSGHLSRVPTLPTMVLVFCVKQNNKYHFINGKLTYLMNHQFQLRSVIRIPT